ncbi:GntR family transcriptional regulator [Plantactinospora sp. BB1]|uniref:GntR family transcriptional regulator n=1 Tax=Plantactinospora sp. BB1 TaxID=2071627 RepID=UPI000D16F100|nr:GntR family transcriptional regulator [Plantactinospora sp. BB1]
MRLGVDRYSGRSMRNRAGSPFRAEAARQGRAARIECHAVCRQPAPIDIAALLLVEAGEQVICRETRYYADGEPVQLGRTYIPLKIANASPLASKKDLGPGGIFERFEDLGYRATRIREQVTTRFPTREEALAIKTQPGVPVLVVMHVASDGNGTPFEVTRFIMRSDLIAIQYAMFVDS